MLFALGALANFILGGVTGIPLGADASDIYLHDTYFVIAHFHNTLVPTAVIAGFAGIYFWFPKMFGRMMNEGLGKLHFWLTFIGVYCVFMPMHYLGLAGNVRRYSAFTDDYLIPLIPVHKFITVAALLTGAAQFIFLFNLIWSRFKGPIASENPWEATSLEWSTTSPPPFDNFGGRHMVVYHGADEYGVQSSDGKDYIMQTSPEKVAAR
jgi:cytochrome c oxidase subunit 1